MRGATVAGQVLPLTLVRTRKGDSLEVLVAHDADKLECTIQCLEYLQQGYPAAREWVDSTCAKLKTASAITLAASAWLTYFHSRVNLVKGLPVTAS